MTPNKTGIEILNDWLDINRAFNNDGVAGVKNLGKLVEDLGYSSSYSIGDYDYSIARFLSDNPDAIEMLKEWIAARLDESDDWRKKIVGVTYDDSDEDE